MSALSYRSNNSSQAGFTLIEVLVSLAILSLMSLGMFVASQQTLNTKERAEGRDESYHAVTQAMNRLASDLDMALIVKSKDLLGFSFDGEYAFEGQEERLDFVSFSHLRFIANARESEVVEVSYYLEPMPEEPQKRMLMRRESTVVDKNLQEGGAAYPILENVERVSFEYLDAKSGEFKKTWDSKSIDFNGQLPQAVKITFEVQLPEREDKTVFTTIAPIRLRGPLS